MDNSNNTTDCVCSWYASASPRLLTVVYLFIFPVLFLVSLTGRILALIAFYQHSKRESPYIYQIMVTVSETFKMCIAVFYVVIFRILSGINGYTGQPWFMSSYHWMSLAAHVPLPLMNTAITCTLLLTVSMVIDRTFALARPFRYRLANHKRTRRLILVGCIGLGLGTSAFYAFRWRVEPEPSGQFFVLKGNDAFMQSLLAKILSQLCSLVRMGGLVLLIGFNIALVRCHHNHGKKLVSMQDLNLLGTRRKEQEKVMTTIAIVQAIFNTASMIILTSQQTYLYLVQNAADVCNGVFLTAVVECIVGICDMIDFYVVFAVSKQFRYMIGNAAVCYVK